MRVNESACKGQVARQLRLGAFFFVFGKKRLIIKLKSKKWGRGHGLVMKLRSFDPTCAAVVLSARLLEISGQERHFECQLTRLKDLVGATF